MTNTDTRPELSAAARQLARRALEYLHNHPCSEETGVPCPDEADLREALDAYFLVEPP